MDILIFDCVLNQFYQKYGFGVLIDLIGIPHSWPKALITEYSWASISFSTSRQSLSQLELWWILGGPAVSRSLRISCHSLLETCPFNWNPISGKAPFTSILYAFNWSNLVTAAPNFRNIINVDHTWKDINYMGSSGFFKVYFLQDIKIKILKWTRQFKYLNLRWVEDIYSLDLYSDHARANF